ncbi:type II toxin-antitoxin system Phd/YefM family antitoxin [Paraburkholderia kururiensis]|uniref:Type II toxin-antitoxin system Phd/YefM family antitoxin n=1 Tax=Paraburkholderia kururiensis TaxID=984307 RepID=A0ABZ0WRF3_9BURK|nr:type II toxin-antitoxin system Phd/YefM family antitoxin [Paraburkholderia kururiensis]WQD79952.1 type II toxin-antitoxin system Phd/YefM family antitoxin [Paraburkholderia kururiensis]
MIRTIMERFVEQSPMAVMARLVMQAAVHGEWMSDAAASDEALREPPVHESGQTREALFSLAVKAMAAIPAPFPSLSPVLHALPAHPGAGFGAAVTALHDSVSRLRSEWGRTLVRDCAELLAPAAAPRRREAAATVAGFRVRVLDSMLVAPAVACMAPAGACGRDTATTAEASTAAALRALPVYDPDLAMVVDLLPYERGFVHERALAAKLLESVRPGELWIMDGRFGANAVLAGWPRGGSAFIVREHACMPVPCRELEPAREAALMEGDAVCEQRVSLSDGCGASLVFRRIEWRRGAVGNGAQASVVVLTNVPAAQLDAARVVELSCRSWSETLPLPLDALCDGAMLAAVPPRAALLASGITALAWNALSAMQAAVNGALDLDDRDLGRLPAYIAAGVDATYAGMMIALPPESWARYDRLGATDLGEIVQHLAVHVDPRSERRKRRENKVSARAQARLRNTTLDRLLRDEADFDVAGPLKLRTIAMATRDFSSNPSKALRDAGEALVMVTKYNRPIALLVSIEDWNRLVGEVRETSLERLSLGYASALANLAPATIAVGEPSLN